MVCLIDIHYPGTSIVPAFHKALSLFFNLRILRLDGKLEYPEDPITGYFGFHHFPIIARRFYAPRLRELVISRAFLLIDDLITLINRHSNSIQSLTLLRTRLEHKESWPVVFKALKCLSHDAFIHIAAPSILPDLPVGFHHNPTIWISIHCGLSNVKVRVLILREANFRPTTFLTFLHSNNYTVL